MTVVLVRPHNVALILTTMVVAASCGGDRIAAPDEPDGVLRIDFTSITSGAQFSCDLT